MVVLRVWPSVAQAIKASNLFYKTTLIISVFRIDISCTNSRRVHHFMILTGTRIGEACGVCWDQVDLKRAEVYIARSISWNHWTRKPYLVDMVKSEDSHRLIHLSQTIVSMFRVMKLENIGGGVVFKK